MGDDYNDHYDNYYEREPDDFTDIDEKAEHERMLRETGQWDPYSDGDTDDPDFGCGYSH